MTVLSTNNFAKTVSHFQICNQNEGQVSAKMSHFWKLICNTWRTKGWQEGRRAGVWEHWGRVMTPNKADAMSHPGFIYPVKPAPSHGRDTSSLSNMAETCSTYLEEISQRGKTRLWCGAMWEGVVVGHCTAWEGAPLPHCCTLPPKARYRLFNFKMRSSSFWRAIYGRSWCTS